MKLKFLKSNVILMLIAMMMLSSCTRKTANSLCPPPLWFPQSLIDKSREWNDVEKQWFIKHTRQQLQLKACN